MSGSAGALLRLCDGAEIGWGLAVGTAENLSLRGEPYAGESYLIGTPMLADYLEEALCAFGLSFEDFEEPL
jgi:hypothetical protein